LRGLDYEGQLGAGEDVRRLPEALHAAAALRAARDSREHHPGESGDGAVLDDLVVLDRLLDLLEESRMLLRVDHPRAIPAARVRHEDAHLHSAGVQLAAQVGHLGDRVLEQAVVLDRGEAVRLEEVEPLRDRELLLEPVQLAGVTKLERSDLGAGSGPRRRGRS